MNCHKGHKIEFWGVVDGIFCHCKCEKKISKNLHNNLTVCSNICFDQRNEKIEQRMYYCLTCGIIGNHGICESCAINCHINHLIKFIGIHKFACNCKKHFTNNMINIQNFHDNRLICDRKMLDKDDISACYICNTCDKTGKNLICETCIFKNHINHDIHFIGYMKFKCHENGLFYFDS